MRKTKSCKSGIIVASAKLDYTYLTATSYVTYVPDMAQITLVGHVIIS